MQPLWDCLLDVGLAESTTSIQKREASGSSRACRLTSATTVDTLRAVGVVTGGVTATLQGVTA